MELNYDWKGFQSVFVPRKRGFNRQNSQVSGPIYAVTRNGSVVAAFSDCEDFTDLSGVALQVVSERYPNRKILSFERDDVDVWIGEGVSMPHFYDQTQFLHDKAAEQVHVLRSRDSRHFVLSAIQGGWAKVLPSAYGVFIRLEGNPARNFFMVVRQGRVDIFQQPDLGMMGPNRGQQPEEVVKYLSEKHLVPVQGLFVSAQEWQLWGQSENPWRKVAMAVRENRAKLVPFRWGFVALMAARAFLGI